jgi:hypothetical protein
LTKVRSPATPNATTLTKTTTTTTTINTTTTTTKHTEKKLNVEFLHALPGHM